MSLLESLSNSKETSSFTVRGYNTYNKKAGFLKLIGVLCMDVLLSFILFCVILLTFNILPIFTYSFLLIFFLCLFICIALPFSIFHVSLGCILWNIKLKNGKFFQPDKTHSSHHLLRVASLLVFSIMAHGFTRETFLNHPFWMNAQLRQFDPFLPDITDTQSMDSTSTPAPAQPEWNILAFFYTLGAWPASFSGHPIFHFLPYEKGPPERFPGHIIARWDVPETKVIFEGPRSPKDTIDPKKLKNCLTHLNTWDCLQVREESLQRPIEEMNEALKPRKWELQWFEVLNSALQEEETQGFFIRASNRYRGQDRYILITPKGAQQSITLYYPMNPEGDQAKDLFQKAIRTLRVSDDLGPGKAWIESQLENTEIESTLNTISKLSLSKANETENQNVLFQLSKAQAYLLSKISVDPKTYDSYFHLAGTSLLLAHYSAIAEKKQSALNTADASDPSSFNNWSIIARPMIQSAYLYSQDIAPQDPRNTQIQGFLIESKKYQ